MNVQELIKKLKKCPPKAEVCWDSNRQDFWFGDTVETMMTTKQELLDEIYDEDGNLTDLLPNSLRSIVKLS